MSAAAQSLQAAPAALSLLPSMAAMQSQLHMMSCTKPHQKPQDSKCHPQTCAACPCGATMHVCPPARHSQYSCCLLQHDVIPRSCLATFEDLRKEIAASNWEDQLKDKVRPGTVVLP